MGTAAATEEAGRHGRGPRATLRSLGDEEGQGWPGHPDASSGPGPGPAVAPLSHPCVFFPRVRAQRAPAAGRHPPRGPGGRAWREQVHEAWGRLVGLSLSVCRSNVGQKPSQRAGTGAHSSGVWSSWAGQGKTRGCEVTLSRYFLSGFKMCDLLLKTKGPLLCKSVCGGVVLRWELPRETNSFWKLLHNLASVHDFPETTDPRRPPEAGEDAGLLKYAGRGLGRTRGQVQQRAPPSAAV